MIRPTARSFLSSATRKGRSSPRRYDASLCPSRRRATEGRTAFVMIASPNVPNGGIFSRLPGLKIPFFVTSNGAAQPSPYGTTYVTNEYDPYSDFPAYFNPLSLLNSLFALAYVHPDQYYDSIDYNPLTGTGTTPVLVKPVTNSAGGTDKYVFVPAAHLPLLAPARQIFGALGLTPLTEPVLAAIEPVLRLLVDMGYTDRENLNPEVPVKFSLITPPARIIETIAQVPGALGQGVNNLTTGGGSLPTSIPAPVAPTIAPTNSPSINARTLPQEPQESLMNTDPPSAGATDPAPPSAGQQTRRRRRRRPAQTRRRPKHRCLRCRTQGQRSERSSRTAIKPPRTPPPARPHHPRKTCSRSWPTHLRDSSPPRRSRRQLHRVQGPMTRRRAARPRRDNRKDQRATPLDGYAFTAVAPMTRRARRSSSSSSVTPRPRRISSLCCPSVGGANRWWRRGPGVIRNGQPG